MMTRAVIAIVALLIAQVLCIPSSLSANLVLTAQDHSSYPVSWYFDAEKQIEKIVYRREGAPDTTDLRFYATGVEYFVMDNVCHKLTVSTNTPTSAERFSEITQDLLLVKWTDSASGPVDASKFEIPAACANVEVEGGVFCATCESVGQSVISLGCNATSAEIAKICGNLFEALCQKVLDELCSGGCQLEECPEQVCCLFDLCSGSSCTNSSSSSTSSLNANTEILGGGVGQVDPQVEGPFCDTCISVGTGVISLGCNATTAEIAKLCGHLFEALCEKVLEEACSGACSLEDCPKDACCALTLCSGSECTGSSTTSSNFINDKLY